MFQFVINSYILVTSILFSQMKHPLSMGMVLLIQTLLISLSVGMMSDTFWFAYIIFLVMLGGMLVMFIYVTAISSNEMFTMSNKLFFILSLISIVLMLPMMFMDSSYFYSIFNLEINPMTLTNNLLMEENTITLMKIYNYSTNLITLFLINYLFLTLVISVKITNFFYGPLRPSSN